MSFPNLEAFLGVEVSAELVQQAGGLPRLVQLAPGKVLHLGLTDSRRMDQGRRMEQLRAGVLAFSPTFVDTFGEETELPAHAVKGARKCLEIISRKCVLLARVDANRGRPDGSLGREERDKLRETCERLAREGMVSETDTQALPVPEVLPPRGDGGDKSGAAQRKVRGGIKLHKRRENQNEVGVLERATARVRMGVSEEQQREELLERADIRQALQRQQEKMMEREGRKRQRTSEAAPSEYDDLLGLSL